MISTMELADAASGRCLRWGLMMSAVSNDAEISGVKGRGLELFTNWFRNLNSSQMNMFGKLTITIKTCQYYANLYFKNAEKRTRQKRNFTVPLKETLSQ